METEAGSKSTGKSPQLSKVSLALIYNCFCSPSILLTENFLRNLFSNSCSHFIAQILEITSSMLKFAANSDSAYLLGLNAVD